MSANRDVTGIVRSWLEEGGTPSPDRVLDAVFDQIPTTRQRRARRPAWRLHIMATPIRIAAAAAVVGILAVAVGIAPTPSGPGGANLVASPSPVPTAIPRPAPTLPYSGAILPGTYRSDFITFMVPAGWTADQSWVVNKGTAMPPAGVAVMPWGQISSVYADPCHWQTTAAPVGPTVDDVVAALVAQDRGGAIVKPVDVTVDGFSGKEIDLMVPLDVNFGACDAGEYHPWTGAPGDDRYNQGPGQHDLLDILDVDGQTLAIGRMFYAGTSASDRVEQQAIFDSITIRPPTAGSDATAAPTP